jgi:hypothetical protein
MPRNNLKTLNYLSKVLLTSYPQGISLGGPRFFDPGIGGQFPQTCPGQLPFIGNIYFTPASSFT